MPLIDVITEKPLPLPHYKDFNRWRKGLSDEEFNLIIEDLNRKIDGDEIHTAGWMPGSDWQGTVYMPIYEKACGSDFEQAALFFGLLVWSVFMKRPEAWACGRYEKEGIPIKSMTYFRVTRSNTL